MSRGEAHEGSAGPTTAVPYAVRIHAEPVSHQVSPPGRAQREHRGREVVDRQPSDRAVTDAVALGALPRQRD